MALGDGEDGDKRECAQKRAQEHDIGARERDGGGDDAVGAKQQQCCQVRKQSVVHTLTSPLYPSMFTMGELDLEEKRI